ncbi:hypothetical protein HPB47_004002 [Ixodes persulcatus]|uniref:Uncharacterized protein n=1 Tax=Ixodes persulcatus TaxID=34615 RepID=A0AC60PGV1_IXOPE|nr:hypothetical protein HPB47_004002 [Ixodes persulcatus]
MSETYGCSRPVPESVREDADASYISFTAGDLYDEESPRSQERRGPARPRAVAPPKPLRHLHYQQHHNPGQRSNAGFPSNWNASKDPFFRRHLAVQSLPRTRSCKRCALTSGFPEKWLFHALCYQILALQFCDRALLRRRTARLFVDVTSLFQVSWESKKRNIAPLFASERDSKWMQR